MVSQGASLATAMGVARLLGMEAFGQFVLVQATSVMLQNLGGLGLGLATTRLVARLRGREPDRAGRVIGFSLLLSLASGSLLALLVLAAPLGLLRSVLATEHLSGTLRWVGVLALSEVLNRIQSDVLVGLEAFSTVAAVSLGRAVLTMSLVILGARAFGLAGAVTGLAAASLLTCLLFQVGLRAACRRQAIGLTFQGVCSEYGVLRTSLFVTASSVALAIVTWGLNVGLAHQVQGVAELAVFNAADRWRTAILFLPGLVAQVSLPLFAHTHAQAGSRECRRLLTGACSASLAVAAVPALTVAAFSGLLMSGYGDAFVQGKRVLILLAVTCVPASVSMVGAYGLWAAGKTATMLAIDLARASITLLVCLLQPSFGAYDVAIATLLGYAVATPLIGLALWRTLESKVADERLDATVVGAGVS